MTDDLHKLLVTLGFAKMSGGGWGAPDEYHHLKYPVVINPTAQTTAADVAEVLMLAGMTLQKTETKTLISEFAKKLGFKF